MDAIERLVPLVDFLGQALGSRTEVVLHDLSDKENSVVAIANGHISGRAVGSPVTDVALRLVKQGAADGASACTRYRGEGVDGRPLRSSSLLLRDAGGDVIGMLCVNVDISGLEALQSLLAEELAAEDAPPSAGPGGPRAVLESFQGTAEELLDTMIDAALASSTRPVAQLTPDERLHLVGDLDEAGLFLLKGGVAATARRLGVSEPSVYRYLQRARAEMGAAGPTSGSSPAVHPEQA